MIDGLRVSFLLSRSGVVENPMANEKKSQKPS
jgi:hypothetical protein